MANTLAGLIPTIYRAMNIVARELVGFIPSVYINSSLEGAALNQTISYPIAPAAVANDITAAATAPVTGSQVIGAGTMTISKARQVPLLWNGEETTSLGNMFSTVQVDQFAQGIRTLCNEVESDTAAAAYKGASRAYGTAGTTPFPTAGLFDDFAQTVKILDDNGCPASDRHFVFNTAASANIRGKQSGLFKVNEAGSSELLRRGILGSVMGFDLHESAKLTLHTKGTGTGYLTNVNAAIGAVSIAVDTGSGTVIAGDVVTQAGDTNKYIVRADLDTTPLLINEPGLLTDTWDDGDAITVGNNYTPNVAFHRNAIHLVTRTPKMPPGGDAATDSMILVDPHSGLAFRVAVYAQHHQVAIMIELCWGVKAVKSPFIVTLLG